MKTKLNTFINGTLQFDMCSRLSDGSIVYYIRENKLHMCFAFISTIADIKVKH